MIGETVVVTRRVVSGEDSQGNPAYTTSEIAIERCAFAPTGSTEDVATFGTRAITGGTVYAPTGTVFLPSDVLTIRGMTFTVDGESGQWTNPYSATGKGVEVAVKRGV